ncbi:hypothetical protein GCM10020367_61670 [Streptomyces sannanensis]|uniref:Oligopeptide/dipeptide ABC transporter C-terminal domain-containing protein n=1 Tax=Streptomyces sannanensis TaxID=285536 RepID=A0ABP6SM29_9ACTN
METAPTETLLRHPRHPYTQALLASVPCLRSPRRMPDEPTLPGEAADPHFPPPGCRFHPRCPVGPRRLPERTLCSTAAPGQTPVEHDELHRVACHFPVPNSRLR